MTSSMRLNGGRILTNGQAARQTGGFTAKVLSSAHGTTLGHPEPLIQVMNTLMTQGSWEVIQKFGNRAPAIVVEIEGQGSDADARAAGLNAGEVWLSSLMGPGALEWLPPGQKVWTVFDVVTSYIDRSEDGDWDANENLWLRRYLIPIKALPYSRSPDLTVTPADPTAGTALVDVQLTDGSATTGFTADWLIPGFRGGGKGNGDLTPAVVSGAVRATLTTTEPTTIRERYVFGTPIVAATPYVRVDTRTFTGSFSSARALAGAAIVEVGDATSSVAPSQQTFTDLGSGIMASTAYYRVPIGATAIRVGSDIPRAVTNAYLEVDQIRRVSRLPDLGTLRQKIAGILPGGSAPADGSLHVSHPTAGLGKVLLHTYPAGRPSPALMQYRTAGTTPVADTAAINNQRIPIQAANLVIDIPDPMLPIRGRAALWAKIQVDTNSATLRWTIQGVTGGFPQGQIQTRDVLVFPSGVLVPLGLVNLPGTVTGSAGLTRLSLRNVAGSGTISVDEVWACGMDEYSALTVVDAIAGTPVSGTSSNHLWVNAPTPDKPAGEVLIGTNDTDARWPEVIQASQVHKFPRGGVSVLTVTTSATDASTDFIHYKRWTHHAAENS